MRELLIEFWKDLEAADLVLNTVSLLFGSLLSWYLFKISLKVPELCCSSISEQMISASAEGLSVSYRGRKVENPHRDRVVFWNSGRATILDSQLKTVDPIKLYLTNAKVLSANIVSMTREAVNPKVTICTNNQFVKVEFDFLGPQDGFVIEIFYDYVANSSNSKSEHSFLPTGTIIDLEHGAQYLGRTYQLPSTHFDALIGLFFAALVVFLGYNIFAASFLKHQLDGSILSLVGTAIGLLVAFSSLQLARLAWKSRPKHRLPKGLDPYKSK